MRYRACGVMILTGGMLAALAAWAGSATAPDGVAYVGVLGGLVELP